MNPLINFCDQFNPFLEKALTEQMESCKELFVHTPHMYGRLEHARHITMSGGKRIRPYLASLSYRAYGGTNTETIQRVGCALECIHSLALMVDDIIDHGEKRHNQTTLHNYIQSQGKPVLTSHIQTVLVSDLYYHWVFDRIASACEQDPSLSHQQIRKQFHHLLNEVLIGEMIDIDLQGSSTASPEAIILKDTLKTASYTCSRPLMIGAVAGGLYDQDTLETVHQLGIFLGCAYQIADDLGDITGLHTDKPTRSDWKEGQQNSITIAINTSTNTALNNHRNRLFGTNTISEDDCIMMKKHFDETTILQSVAAQGHDNLTKARTILGSLQRSSDYKQELSAIITLIEKRLTI